MHRRTFDFAASELLTFSRLEPIRVIDLEYRLAKAGVPDDEKGSADWAKQTLASKSAVRSLSDLSFDYSRHLKEDFDLRAGLPSRDELRTADSFDGAKIAQNPAYRGDQRRAQATFLALALDPARDEAAFQDAARLLQFVERFPRLSEERSQASFAPVLRRGPKVEKEPAAKPEPEPTANQALHPLDELTDLAATLQTIWRSRDTEVSQLRTDYLNLRNTRAGLLREALAEAVIPPAKSKATKATRGASAKSVDREQMQLRAQAMNAARLEVKGKIEAARGAYLSAQAKSTLAAVLSRKNDSNSSAIDRLKALMNKYKLSADGFCQLYAMALEKIDQIDRPRQRTSLYPTQAAQSWDAPGVSFTDSVRMLGKAELVRVEEEFVSYSPAEISYIQTVMPGEQRMRKTRSANVQETILEDLNDELTERIDETSASTKSELKSEIETELKSRFASSVSASGSGEGGGSLGVVNFSGSGGVNAGLDIGLDTGLRTKNETQFTQEVLRKAVERTNRRTMERRLTRSRQSFSASDVHQITNDTDKPINGTYVFLNKHVAITETVYGVRAFMEAKLLAPGRSLIAARRSQQRALLDEFGERPRFDLTPADITPANYMLNRPGFAGGYFA
jgi:hypothetical protein